MARAGRGTLISSRNESKIRVWKSSHSVGSGSEAAVLARQTLGLTRCRGCNLLWRLELKPEKTLRCLCYLLFKPFPSFCYLSYFAKTEGSGEMPPIDLKTRLAGRLALPITGSEQKKTKTTENQVDAPDRSGFKFLAQVTKPQVLVNASAPSPKSLWFRRRSVGYFSRGERSAHM